MFPSLQRCQSQYSCGDLRNCLHWSCCSHRLVLFYLPKFYICNCIHLLLLVAQSCPTLCDPMDCRQPTRLICPGDYPGKNTAVGCHFLLQGIFPTRGSNLGLPHCMQILYSLSHQDSTKLLTCPLLLQILQKKNLRDAGRPKPRKDQFLEN